MLHIPIVVTAFNRESSLTRLLRSLASALYPTNVDLIISIDGGNENTQVLEVAKHFRWQHGKKDVIASTHHLGLRNHILECGRLSKEYDGIVLLEDDLCVSPYFYDYLIRAHSAYETDERITGIALYSHQYNETACLPFRPFDDGQDVFFMQVACSWGQSWLRSQWEAFDIWYEVNGNIDLAMDTTVPPDVRLWPETSWKKYYVKYMIENGMYFVYPRVSLSTNFADPGTHHRGSNIFQVPLLGGPKEYSFPDRGGSIARYDAYCEVKPELLRPYLREVKGRDFEVDLYGMKSCRDVSSEFVLTTQTLQHPIKWFGRKLKPHEANIYSDVPGTDIGLGETSGLPDYGNFLAHRNRLNQDYEITHSYFYSITPQHYRHRQSVKELLTSLPGRFKLLLKRILRWGRTDEG